MKIAVDTNLLVYAQGLNGQERQRAAEQILRLLSDEALHLPAQVALELQHVLLYKARLSSEAASAYVAGWVGSAVFIPTDERVVSAAMALHRRQKLAWFDAVVLASAAVAQCELLMSEDFQHGFSWRGVTVRNPFAAG